MKPAVGRRSPVLFKSVRLEGDVAESPRTCCMEVSEGRVVIDHGLVEIGVEDALQVSMDRHTGRRVKVEFREDGTERAVYLSSNRRLGRMRGNQRLYSQVHEALVHHDRGLYGTTA